MLEHLNASSDAKSIRDTAIIRALYGMGLRRVELISLDLCDLDLAEARMAILGKAGWRRREHFDPTKNP
ncbi:MAG: hypothetical protein IPN91_13830 [Holophagaceae bacterium]|uniref:Tyr recombinase domain-containing protein n=1 Tax=Candidatus Geothrix odensensis TaxID=2954440 RepID=A0A936F3X4_9BACT|nr:hypothetical protein [Candidatus Geothrix odensensis]